MAKKAAARNNVTQLPKPASQHFDGWINMLTAIGLKGRDKRRSGTFEATRLSELDCEELWRGDDLAARIIETAPDEMLRQGFEVQIQDLQEPEPDVPEQSIEDPNFEEEGAELAAPPVRADRRRRRDLAGAVFPEPDDERASMDGKRAAEATAALVEELEITNRLVEAAKQSRAYGGSSILLGAKDGATDLRKPLDLDKIQALEWLTVLSPREHWPVQWYRDPAKAKFGEPEIYRIQQEIGGALSVRAVEVHESRLVRFDGVRVSRRQTRGQRGWGDSVLVRVAEVLNDFQSSWQGAGILLSDFAQAIFKIEGLAQLIAANEDDVVIRRAQLVDLSRSIARAILIDSKEDFERKTTNLAGLPEMLREFSLRLAAAARMPVMILMGQSPGGLQATGAPEIRWWYDSIAAERERVLRPRLNRILKIIFLSKKGPTGGIEPANWTVKFPPLWQLTDLEQAELRNKQANTDKIYIDAQVLMPEEVAISRFGGDAYSSDTILDRKIREAFDEGAEQREAAAAAATAALAAAGATAPGRQAPGAEETEAEIEVEPA